MTDTFLTKQVSCPEQIREVAEIANTIWHQHFTPIIGGEQVDYMLDKFQSFPALTEQIENGYEYYELFFNNMLCGYCGIHPENGKLFLSKLYLKQECRGLHLASRTFLFLKELCRKRGLSSIWLTCNKNNTDTLNVYRHFGFETISTQKADIGGGYIMDDYIMEYKLS